ncbi:hypothetical protein [Actinomadura hibisca]|uniref:hypothetical protein n=1 Tax=Actinomadura hibisca TaxID=68565 RepID=UPI00082A37DB|nr:hypothetical protein [Actinomadura hibisca]
MTTARSEEVIRLLDAARELAEMAVEIRESSLRVAGAASSGRDAGTSARYRLLRAVANPRGLGFTPGGGRFGGLTARVGGMLGAESIAVRLLVASLRLRIAAVALENPELADDPLLRRLLDEVAADRRAQAARTLRALLRERGTMGTITAVAPVFSELLALNALLDENPFNDRTAWLIATGTGTACADPVSGISNMAVAVLDKGRGAVRPATLDRAETARLRTEGSLLAFLGNIAVIGTTGRILLQAVTGPDGATRYVLQAPGMRAGRANNESPQDLLGAFSSTLIAQSPYSRSLIRAVEEYGVPDGAELALIGHSAGGAAVMNLVQDAAFCARYTVTHAVAIGSPIDFKAPADPLTWVAGVANQRDIIPSLDGQGAGNCFDLHPGWYVVDYPDPAATFPECHSIEHYIADMERRVPEAREHIDEQLAPYRGPVTRSQVYRLFDRAPRPDGFPFLTVPTYTMPCAEETLELPIRSPSGATLTAYFAADTTTARDLLADTGLTDVIAFGRRCLVAVHAFAHPQASIGAHNRIDLTIPVHDPWSPQRLPGWPDLLRPVDRRRGGDFVTDSAVSTAGARLAVQEIWGHPAFETHVDVAVGSRNACLKIGDVADRVLTLTGQLGFGLPTSARDLLTYSQRDGTILRAGTELRGRARLHPRPRLRLRVTASPHPMAAHLRALGLDGARPLFCLSVPNCQSRASAGVPIQLT